MYEMELRDYAKGMIASLLEYLEKRIISGNIGVSEYTDCLCKLYRTLNEYEEDVI